MEDNLIDFTEAKLKQMYEEYKVHNQAAADDILNALLEYKKGNAKVMWKDGLPYVKYEKNT
jgi:hypothetical protein|tara:strand:+ start:235 stop:417 length:183 start_codon:yes stop_codon:yes gene_type:complete